MTEDGGKGAPKGGPDLDPATLSLFRTRLSADRTLMSWMRTSVSLIGFGFTIYKFFEYLHASQLGGATRFPHEPRVLAILLISLGLLFLIVGVLEYRRFVWRLGERVRRGWATLFTAVLLWGLGLLALATIVFDESPG